LLLMMVLEFFIWGAWFPLIFSYLPSLGFSATEQSWILSAFPLAAIVGMFFSNQFADRNFAAERFMSASHLVSGVAMLSLAWARSFWPFFVPGVASLLLSGFSLRLPHTPPKPATGANRFAWLEAVRLLRTPFILVLWLVTFVDSTVHNLFFNWTGTFLGTAATAGGVGI